MTVKFTPNQVIEHARKLNPETFEDFVVNHIQRHEWTLEEIQLGLITNVVKPDPSKVAAYSQLDLKSIPPIVVTQTYGMPGYILLDGVHRMAVLLAQRYTTVIAYVGRKTHIQ